MNTEFALSKFANVETRRKHAFSESLFKLSETIASRASWLKVASISLWVDCIFAFAFFFFLLTSTGGGIVPLAAFWGIFFIHLLLVLVICNLLTACFRSRPKSFNKIMKMERDIYSFYLKNQEEGDKTWKEPHWQRLFQQMREPTLLNHRHRA